MSPTTRPVGRSGRALALSRALAAFVAIVALLVGSPVLMWRLVGWPLPHHLPAAGQISQALSQPLTDGLVLDVLGCVFWYAWLALAVSFTTELVAQLTGKTGPRIPTLGPGQALAAALITAITAGVLAAALRAPKPAPSGGGLDAAFAARRTVAAATATAHPGPPAPVTRQHATVPATPTAGLPTIVVAQGNSLWGLADRHLGDGLRWRQIYTLNAHRPQPDGDRLDDPDIIRSGWLLTLPADATNLPTPSPPPTTRPQPPAPTTPGTPRTSTAPSSTPTGPAASTEVGTAATPWTPTLTPTTRPTPHATPPPIPTAQLGTVPPAGHHTLAATGPSRTPAPSRTRGPGPVVRLPSGAVLPVALLGAVAAAVTLARLLRTRRMRLPAPPDALPPAQPPLALVVREILRAERAHPDDDQDPTPAEPATLDTPAAGLPPSDPVADETSRTPTAESARGGGLDLLPDGLAGSGTLALDGPGAHAAARAIIVTLLVGHHRDYPRTPRPWPAWLLIPTTTAGHLDLPVDLLDALPQTTLTNDATALADRLDAEALHRRRAMNDAAVTTVADLRAAVDDDAFPTVLAVLDQTDPGLERRLQALGADAARLGLHLLTLGPAPDTVALDADGHQAGPDGGTPWPQLSASDAADLLRLTTAAHDLTPDPTPTTPTPDTNHHQGVDTVTGAASNGTGPQPTADDSPPRAASTPATDTRVRLQVFGRPTLLIDGQPRTTGLLARSLEVAAYLAVHRGGVTGDQLITDLLPDRPATKARNLIYQAIAHLRAGLRTATDQDGTHYLPGDKKTGYRLDPDQVTVDLWEFETALADAGRARTDPDRVGALCRAVALATEPAFGDTAYEWAAPPAADLEHRTLAALADLADLHADTQPDQALAYLEIALGLAPHVEALYVHMMRIHAATGRPDAARLTYQRLTDALEPLGVDPSPETQATLARITRR
jgi:DNA-binding SARP family transcriptional activator